ncbi:helix-turn-helix domain-containing protein [Carnobacterium funditum]|uniref:helix-turn-helix domain-containing protein n=1 Tax=Carnobacterium funditum TaxID=2752 RepID=UPI000555505A|nr:helix-turn-helix domain-containing protein [Carnobacterium funditum]
MALSKLLDAASFRRLQLIEILISDDTWRTIEKLSDNLKCSRRTLIADIQMINSHSEDNFFIKTSKQRGVKLFTSDLFHMEEIYKDLVESSLNFQIIKKVIELDVTTCEDLSELLYTSQSSINRNLKQINLFLAEYDLIIHSNPIKITGMEKQIRYFYSIFLSEYYSSNMNDFQHPLKNTANHFLEQLEREREAYPYSFLTHHRTLIWMTVCSDRVSKGHFIEDNYAIPEVINASIEQVLSRLVKQLPFEVPNREKTFMMYIFWNNHREFNIENLASDPVLQSAHKDVSSFIEKIKKETGYEIENQALLITNLIGYCFYHDFFKGPSNLLFSPERRLYGPSLKMFKEFIEIVSKTVKQYPQGSWVREVQLDEFIFILILFWKSLVPQIISKKEKIQILVISYIGIHQELFISDMLQARFPTLVTCYAATEIASYHKDIQIVLTDHNVKWMKQKMDFTKKVIGIETIPTKRDWKRIEEMIDKFK